MVHGDMIRDYLLGRSMSSYDLVECTLEVDPNDDSLLLHTWHGK